MKFPILVGDSFLVFVIFKIRTSTMYLHDFGIIHVYKLPSIGTEHEYKEAHISYMNIFKIYTTFPYHTSKNHKAL